jgi:hypothetical protein
MTQHINPHPPTSLNPRLSRQMQLVPRMHPAPYYKHSKAALVYSVGIAIAGLAAGLLLLVIGGKN